MAKPSGMIGLFPRFLQPTVLKSAYGCYIGGWSPFGLLPSLNEAAWPVNLWLGDAERGKHIANRRFALAGCDVSFSKKVGWHSKEGTLQWLRALHGFGWMHDVAAHLETKAATKLLYGYIREWMESSEGLHAVAGEPDVIGERLANWIILSRVILRVSPPAFRRRFLRSIVLQALELRRQIRAEDSNWGLPALKGMLYVALSLPQCGIFYKDILRLLQEKATPLANFEPGTISRNPTELHATLRTAIDIQTALRRLGKRDLLKLNEAIQSMFVCLKHIQHMDGGFSLFHGGIEGEKAEIRQTMGAAQEIISALASSTPANMAPTALMERTGYGRLEAGTSAIIIDAQAPQQVDSDTYYSTLAFEMSHGSQRYVVNCGAFIGNDMAWSKVVKTTAAHSTLCIDDRNSCQFNADLISEGGALSGAYQPAVERRIAEREGYHFFEGLYNGYAPYTGLLHSRQLLINHNGTRFSGADHLTVAEGRKNLRSHDVTLRFHLHPAVQARRLMNGMITLKPAESEEEWTFHSSAGQAVELEESIYLGAGGNPQATSQIVIYAPYDPQEKWTVEWSFIKS